MRVIYFTYRSVQVQPSVFLLLFFRMCGIYVYENYLDEDIRVESTENINKDLNEITDSDVTIYLINTEDDLKDIRYKSHVIFIVTQEIFSKLKKSNEKKLGQNYVLYMPNKNQELLNDLIIKLEQCNIINAHEKIELMALVNWYAKQNICDLVLKGKYFYPAQTESEFEYIKKRYQKAANDLFNIWKMFSKVEYVYLQYAMIDIFYQTNWYCIRCNKTPIYIATQLISVCKELLVIAQKFRKIELGTYMLLGQIYEDLAMDPNVAYEYYLLACKPYNAYAYFRKAIYWKNYKKNISNAKKYYVDSLKCFPNYYRAWYSLGCCYVATEEYKSAVTALHNVGMILKNRLSSHVLRTMEIDYLFKSYTCCAYIYYNYLGDIYQAIKENINAVLVWEEIDKSLFWDTVTTDLSQELKDRARNKLNINDIYMVICKLAMKIGDKELIEEYQQKVKMNGGLRNAEKQTT